MPAALVLAALVNPTVALADQPARNPAEGPPQMLVTRKLEMKTVEGPSEYFTGRVTITGQFQRPDPSRVGGAIVHFEPGARTGRAAGHFNA